MSAFPRPGRAQQQVQDVSFLQTPVAEILAANDTSKSQTRKHSKPVTRGSSRANVIAAPSGASGRVLASSAVTVPWPTPMDVSPNVFWRSALFRCRRAGVETIYDRAGREVGTRPCSTGNRPLLIASTPQYTIEYEGEYLCQFDAQVLLLCCATARAAGDMGACVAFSFNEWNRLMGKTQSGSNNARIHASLKRLFKGVLSVNFEGVGIEHMHFLSHFSEDTRYPKKRVYYIRINPDMLPLFAGDATEINIKRSARLRKSLSLWLHNFYSTHDGRFDYAVGQLHQLSGTDLPMYSFRKALKEAIVELQTCEDPLFGTETRIKADKLCVVKLSQSRLLKAVTPPEPASAQLPAVHAEEKRDMSPEGRARYQRSRVAL